MTDPGSGAPRILIAGGGMVGLSLALLLARRLPAPAQIQLVEGMALPPAGDRSAPYHPSFDARSTALSYSTAEIYRGLGLWAALAPGVAPIESIHVSRRGHFGSSCLSAEEQGWEALGWVVENACLGRTLLAAVQAEPRIALRCPARVTGAEACGAGVSVSISAAAPAAEGMPAEAGDTVEYADLLVIADGAESSLRDGLGFFSRRRSYGQDALIANIAFPQSLAGCAYERFTASGPLALLPLPPSADASHRAALVWTLPPDRAASLAEADQEHFADALVEAFGYRLGRPLKVGARHRYALALTEAVEQVRRGMVILGNAAHALHPVAGQGFNLSLRDADALAGTLAAAIAAGASPGDTGVLESYLDARQRDQAQTIFASDGLPRLFALSDPLLGLSRDLALSGLDLVPAARRLFVSQAAGMAALEATRA
jgi:2-octaprenyl-6-methoxyphenol hydroxylase